MAPPIHPVEFTYALCLPRPIESDGAPGIFEIVAKKFKDWLRRNQARYELQRMSDYQLRDIGVMRHEISLALRGFACDGR